MYLKKAKTIVIKIGVMNVLMPEWIEVPIPIKNKVISMFLYMDISLFLNDEIEDLNKTKMKIKPKIPCSAKSRDNSVCVEIP